jgi:transcription elongation GreA/GreB family factor
MKKKIAAAAAVGAAVAATMLAIPAYATTVEVFHNLSNSRLCLDADAGNGNVGPGANVTAWYCNGGSNQLWTVVGDGTIRNFSNSSLCLDADARNGNVGLGANVTAWYCNGGSNQKWPATPV